ncbi:hypothetical protein AVEN_214973-1 [Araneus ventricosus]|uniref:Uncharacterized protein n=1 Tax=Araneus ventricosus TaxID=182803 RepID=A0A4Y2RUC2_ARAVE|nr:hypothetical protein AVEN_231163-1 [Araneus ventricosus]GBN79462.1 hypothetical protein AVEN_214973-1 [Araneus ventricosus]
MALEFARRGDPICPTGARFPRQGARPAVWGDECNEIGLKFLTDYYSSTKTPTDTKFCPLAPPLVVLSHGLIGLYPRDVINPGASKSLLY